MRKKYLSALLFGALLFASAGTFTSCKDYDDDINSLQTQITANADAIKKLQDMMGQGQYVTGVTKTDEGLVFTMSNGGASITIPIADGVDGTVITLDSKTNNWIINGVDTGICAKGEAGTDGHSPQIDAATGCWKVWDDEKQEWVITDQSAIGAQTYVVTYESYYELNVMEQDAEGNNLGFKAIKLPISGTLMSITPALNVEGYETTGQQALDIYYGILTSDKEWKGNKAVNGKMLAGMYPTTDRDIKMLLNPSDVDANDYEWTFVSTDNTTPWGLEFGNPEVWTGKATVATRAITSANGLWSLPRDIQRVDLNSSEMQGRPDYVTQFKANDGNKYLFALQGTSKVDGKSVKSGYVYTFKANNVNSTDNINLNGITVNISGKTFVYDKQYTPTFDMLSSSMNDYQTLAEDSALVYDFYLTIDETKITAESIRKYGVEITPDGYSFIAKNEAVVNNTIPFIYNYILINGQTGSCKFNVSFTDEEVIVDNKYIGDLTTSFDATVIENQTRWYAMSKVLPLNEFFEGLGESGKMKWIDALARNIGNTTDPNEWNNTIFDKCYGSEDTDYSVILTGGDPINNQGSWDANAYNAYLLNRYIRFDYVDADGNTCLTGDIRDLNKITGLKVTFLVDSELGQVHAPYYTVDNQKYHTQEAALPLDNAFRIEITTRAEEAEIAKMNFTFELTMPNCPIERKTVGNQTTAWSTENGIDVLKIYGEKLDDKQLAGDLRDAFTGAFQYFNGAYNGKMNVEANWYEAQIPLDNLTMTILGKQRGETVTLSEIANSSEYNKWNTIGMYGAGSLDEAKLVNVKYHHFGVYTEEQGDIILKFASKVKDSQKATVKSAGTEANPFIAKAVYDKQTKELDRYEFSVSNNDFTMTDAFGNAYYLFDNDKVYRANLHVKLLEDRQGIVTDKNEPSFYGLYPSAKVDGATTDLVTFKLDKDGVTDYTTKMTMEINKAAGVDKVIEITYNVTDVFGCVKPVTFYVRTVNEAIGNDDK